MKYATRYIRSLSTHCLRQNIIGVFYDWDGTLMEFRGQQFLESMNNALASYGYPEIKSLSGSKSIRDTFAKATKCPVKAAQVLAAFREDFSAHPLSRRNLMPGAEELIKRVKTYGVFQGVVSNLDHELLTAEINKLELTDYFSVVIGSKHDEHLKPKPDLIMEALATIGSTRSKSVLYIGDTISDIISANIAGCTSVLVATQVDKKVDSTLPPDSKPDIIASNLEQIKKIIEQAVKQQSRSL